MKTLLRLKIAWKIFRLARYERVGQFLVNRLTIEAMNEDCLFNMSDREFLMWITRKME